MRGDRLVRNSAGGRSSERPGDPPSDGRAADHGAERSDAAPDAVQLRLDARMIRVPGWWAEAEGYRAGETLRPADVDRAEAVSAAARGALAEMDRLTARRLAAARPRAPRARRAAGKAPGMGRLAAVATMSSALTLAAAYLLSWAFG